MVRSKVPRVYKTGLCSFFIASAFIIDGYLNLTRRNYDEAKEALLKAVVLDPDYLNAWQKLDEIYDSQSATPQEQDDAIFAMLRLDPRQRHVHPDVSQVEDLERLWFALRAIPAPDESQELFPLTASAAAKSKANESEEDAFYFESTSYFDQQQWRLSHQATLSALTQLADTWLHSSSY